ncbi:MAG: class I SAM-dependent methyltransferase [Pyrinomonadaceae bacterium]
MSIDKTHWFVSKRRRRAARARERQLDYQEKKAAELDGNEKNVILNMMKQTAKVKQMLEQIRPLDKTNSVLEVGSGAHGLIFTFGNNFCVGIDPLAVDYKRLFPVWQKNVQTISAIGEQLPFADASFDIALSDNVVDHAENPAMIIRELVRVLKPDGLLYFTVNVHHRLYSIASDLHGWWNAVGINFELSPFADHTVHFTLKEIRRIFSDLPLYIFKEKIYFSDFINQSQLVKSRNPVDLLKKMFFKNVLFEIVAVKKKALS